MNCRPFVCLILGPCQRLLAALPAPAHSPCHNLCLSHSLFLVSSSSSSFLYGSLENSGTHLRAQILRQSARNGYRRGAMRITPASRCQLQGFCFPFTFIFFSVSALRYPGVFSSRLCEMDAYLPRYLFLLAWLGVGARALGWMPTYVCVLGAN